MSYGNDISRVNTLKDLMNERSAPDTWIGGQSHMRATAEDHYIGNDDGPDQGQSDLRCSAGRNSERWPKAPPAVCDSGRRVSFASGERIHRAAETFH